MIRLLIDECLSTALVGVARERGHPVDHVTYLGLAGRQDWNLIPVIEAGDYCFVTNNRGDFLRLYSRQPLHNGLIVIGPNTHRQVQTDLFGRVLDELRRLPDLINQVIEIDVEGRVTRFPWPGDGSAPRRGNALTPVAGGLASTGKGGGRPRRE